MTSNKTLNIRVSGAADALDRFEAAWHLASGRKPPEPVSVLSFADLPLLLKTLTSARWTLLEKLRAAGPQSILGLAKLLERDYKNVHTDVGQLLALGLIEKSEDGKILVPWKKIRAEL
jgi:predicted transcriptional regulator